MKKYRNQKSLKEDFKYLKPIFQMRTRPRLLRNSEEVKQYDSYQKLMSVLLDIRRSSEVTEFDLSITKELVIEIESYLEGKDEVSPNYFKRIYSILDKLHNLYDEYNYNDPIDKFIFRALKNEFINELLNKRNGAKEAYLSLEMDDFKVFEITFNNKEILSFNSERLCCIKILKIELS